MRAKSVLTTLKHSFTLDTGFLLVATASGYGFSYLYLLAMGRMLGPEPYGILGALFAIFYSVSLLGQGLMEAIATNLAAVRATSGEAAAIGVFRRLSLRLALVFLIPAAALMIFSRPVAEFFHLTYIGPVILLAVSIYTALLINTVLGLLQGLQKFRQFGVTGYLVAQGSKLVTGVTFVWVGWDLMGAVGALVAATTIGTALGLVLARRHLAGASHDTGGYHVHLGHVFLPTFLLAVFLSVPASADVILVTHYFGGDDAGFYNAVATLGKVIVFLPMAVSLMLLPRATENHAMGRDTRKILYEGFALTFVLSGLVAVIFWVLPDTVITLFFGDAYHQGGSLVGLYSLAMLLFSLNVVLIHYSLAVRNFWLIFIVDLVTVAEVVAIVVIHQTISQIIWILVAGNAVMLLLSLPWLTVAKARHDTMELTG